MAGGFYQGTQDLVVYIGWLQFGWGAVRVWDGSSSSGFRSHRFLQGRCPLRFCTASAENVNDSGGSGFDVVGSSWHELGKLALSSLMGEERVL